MRADQTIAAFDPHKVARLVAALDALEATESLIMQVRQGETFLAARPEVRDAAEQLSDVRALLRTALVAERGR